MSSFVKVELQGELKMLCLFLLRNNYNVYFDYNFMNFIGYKLFLRRNLPEIQCSFFKKIHIMVIIANQLKTFKLSLLSNDLSKNFTKYSRRIFLSNNGKEKKAKHFFCLK